MEVGPLRIHLIGGGKVLGSDVFDFKDDGSLNELRERAVGIFERKWSEYYFTEAVLTVRDGPSLMPEATIIAQMRDRKKSGRPMELNLTVEDQKKEDPLDIPIREVSHSISVNATANVDQLNVLLANNEELIAAWQAYDTAVNVMESALTQVKTHMSAFARTHALLTPQLVKGFFEVLRRFPTRDTGKPFVEVLTKSASAVEPIRKEHREYQAALATVDTAQKKLALIQKENVKGKTPNERQMVKLTEALRECERATTAVNIPKLQYQSKLQDLQFTRALAVLELMAAGLSIRATQHATCKGLMDTAGKEGKDLLAVSKKRQEEFSATKERNFEKIQQSMVSQSLKGGEIMNPDVFQARMMFVVPPVVPAVLVGEVIKRRLAQAIFLDADRFIPGEFVLTRYRLAFVAYSFSKSDTKASKLDDPRAKPEETKSEMEIAFSLPLVSLLRIDELENKMYLFTSKDLSTLSISLIHCTKPDGPPLIQGDNKADQYSLSNAAFWTEVRNFAFDWPFYAYEHCTKFRASLTVPNAEDGWSLYSPMAEWNRLAVPNKYFRVSDINTDYSFAPTYPKLLVFPTGADDNFMNAAGPFRSKSRCPTLHWCMRRRGSEGPPFVGIYGCSQPKVGFQGHRNLWDENLLELCSGAENGSNSLPERPTEMKPSQSVLPGPGKKLVKNMVGDSSTDGKDKGKSRFPWSSAKPSTSNYTDVASQHHYLKLQSSSVASPYHRIILLEKPNTSFPYHEIASDDNAADLRTVWDVLQDLPHPETMKDMRPEARLIFVTDFLQKGSREPSVNLGSGGVHEEDYFDEDEESLESMDPEERAAYEHIKKLNEQPLDRSHTRAAVIVDCRPYVNALANVAKGYGWENTALYKRCSIKFLNIPNIHVMRECMSQLRSLFLSLLKSDASGPQKEAQEEDPYRHITLELRNNSEGCKWFKWLSLILEGAVGCVRHMLDGKPVVVHCSDGWDRTPQVIALTLLMLDPYFRTIKGFGVLVEKEFISYGHKFADRMGHDLDRANPKIKERSPVFLQWLDCVFQLVHQFPSQFEFDGRLLARLADHIFSCKYGSFFGNNEKDRETEKIPSRTMSAWTPILGNIKAFRSAYFKESRSGSLGSSDEGVVIQDFEVLMPKCGVSDMVLFTEFYQRWDPRKTASCSLLTSYESNIINTSSNASNSSPSVPPAVPPPYPVPARALPSALLRSINQPLPRLPSANVDPDSPRPVDTLRATESSRPDADPRGRPPPSRNLAAVLPPLGEASRAPPGDVPPRSPGDVPPRSPGDVPPRSPGDVQRQGDGPMSRPPPPSRAGTLRNIALTPPVLPSSLKPVKPSRAPE